MNAAVDRYLGAQAAMAPRLAGGGLPWVRDWRERNARRFAELGLPTVRNEAWKYTKLSVLEKQSFTPAGEAGVVNDVDAWALPCPSHRLVLVDGHYAPGLSSIGHLPHRAVVRSLADALATLPQLVEGALAGQVESDAFGALNAALSADGVLIDLGESVVVEEPIHVLHLVTKPGVLSNPRCLILANAGAAATVIEEHLGLIDESYFANVFTSATLGREARVTHIRLQRESGKAQHIAALRARQAGGSSLHSHALSFGGALSRQSISTRFEEPGCEAVLNGLYVLGGRQHADHFTTIDHASPQGTSRELYRGILDAASHGVFTGRVVVHPHAQGTDSAQANHNLLLSREAEVDTRPQLEIYADDVKCSHGATVGQIDENMLFYLRSRGVGLELARNLLIHGFAQEVIEQIPVAAVRERLEQLLIARMPEHQSLEGLL